MHVVTDYEFQYRDRIINIEVDARIWPGRPAQTYGPPENYYPEEPTELEIESVTVLNIEWNGNIINRDDRPAWNRLDKLVLGLAEEDNLLADYIYDCGIESQEDWRY